MPTVQRSALATLPVVVGLLTALSAAAGVGPTGWLVALVLVAAGIVLLDEAQLHQGLAVRGGRVVRRAVLGPADAVTLVRATLACVVAGLVVDSFRGPVPVAPLVGLASVALVLDWVDGRVARRTRTVTALGARFDLEVDAFLILVLSAYAVRPIGPWVLAIGLARYALLLAERVLPWLRRPTPPRPWAKTVAAVQGVALTVVAADVLPTLVATVVLALALLLLAESFGHQVGWLWRTRGDDGRPRPELDDGAAGPARVPPGLRRLASVLVSVAAVLLVWAALTLPDHLADVGPVAFVRLPVEALVLAAAALLLPARRRARLAWVAGGLLGVVLALRLLDLAFREALDRPFDVLRDWGYAGAFVGLLRDSFGRVPGTVLLVLVAAVLLGALVLVPLALRRVDRLVERHQRRTAPAVVALSGAWLVLTVFGTQVDGRPLASADAAAYLWHQGARVPAALREQRAFGRATTHDPLTRTLATTPPDRLLRGLRGKDVLLVFVESYGRVAVEDPAISPGVRRVLADGDRRLAARGFSARSAFLTSPTYGAISWLAHSTLQSGLWVDTQQRYDLLVGSRRSTLSHAFSRAGWRTVSDVPADTHDWPQGAFYGYDRFYDSRDVGYAGPRFGYPTMPDQYTLEAFQRLELARTDRRPVMAEIDLISSHAPWSRTPRMIDPRLVGDGSAYDGMPATLPSEKDIWPSPARVRAAYGRSIEYTLSALVSFVERHGTDRTVLVVLGDHQPATLVSGRDAGHDVPVSVVAHDPAVLRRIDGWGWQPGLLPGPAAPVARMDSFRDRFLRAYAR